MDDKSAPLNVNHGLSLHHHKPPTRVDSCFARVRDQLCAAVGVLDPDEIIDLCRRVEAYTEGVALGAMMPLPEATPAGENIVEFSPHPRKSKLP